MKTLHLTAPLLLALGLAACQKPHPAAEVPAAAKDVTTQTTGLSEEAAQIGPNAVWTGSIESCRTDTAADNCLLQVMRSGAASPAALTAASTLSAQGKPGYVTAWQNVEGVGVATLEFPFRANTNEGTWLVDANGHAVDVDEEVFDDSTRGSDAYKAFNARHPDSGPFAPALPAGTQALPDGGVRLRYTTPLRSCHACADDGHVTLGYDFDAQRRFVGKQLLELR
ncbi:hypothetical protein [uncultured Stenotrophomonas sp.]|uniref:hypothetical protein n=1 Tax=uncultured Stenotrophomonas sp. TaxID=165438 RepID=UPI0025D5CD38|nr:hypothetical protein [uncultured Stenotrophomonas sp.]